MRNFSRRNFTTTNGMVTYHLKIGDRIRFKGERRWWLFAVYSPAKKSGQHAVVCLAKVDAPGVWERMIGAPYLADAIKEVSL